MCVIIKIRPCHISCFVDKCRRRAERISFRCHRARRARRLCENASTFNRVVAIANVFPGFCPPVRGEPAQYPLQEYPDSQGDLDEGYYSDEVCSGYSLEQPESRPSRSNGSVYSLEKPGSYATRSNGTVYRLEQPRSYPTRSNGSIYSLDEPGCHSARSNGSVYSSDEPRSGSESSNPPPPYVLLD